ncbi:MAG: hypothetical protein B7Y99_00225 [Caulobacterales bacterium 32-69-10]|nr:MAG: hypothetical protein B7Y99_00225 [Caulobacterales bacterium 32-69-10]
MDGKPPGPDHGVDADADGRGIADRQAVFQLVRQIKPSSGYREFEIEFLDPGIRAFTFTFG